MLLDKLKRTDLRDATLIVADMHVNSTTGICPSIVPLDDGGSYRPSLFQGALWEAWEDMIITAKHKVGKRKLVLILNGDTIEGAVKHRTHQVITTNRATANRIAADVLEPLLAICDRWYVNRGTEAHVGLSAEMEEALAADIGAVKDGDTYSHWLLKRIIGGTRFDVSHHASMGGLPWTEKNAANKIAYLVKSKYLDEELPLPDFAIRSHVHRVSDSGINYKVRALTTPCWQGATSHIHRISQGDSVPHIGAFLFVDGELTHLKYEIKEAVKGWAVG